MYQALVISDSLILVYPLDLDGGLICFPIVVHQKLVLVIVLQHVFNGQPKPGEVVSNGKGKPEILDYFLHRVVLENILPIVRLPVAALKLLLNLRLEYRDGLVIKLQQRLFLTHDNIIAHRESNYKFTSACMTYRRE